MVTRTETWIPNPVLGDMPVETTYSGYKDFNGVKFPTMIVQKQGGYPVLDLAVTSVQPNRRSQPAPCRTQSRRQPAAGKSDDRKRLADGDLVPCRW